MIKSDLKENEEYYINLYSEEYFELQMNIVHGDFSTLKQKMENMFLDTVDRKERRK